MSAYTLRTSQAGTSVTTQRIFKTSVASDTRDPQRFGRWGDTEPSRSRCGAPLTTQCAWREIPKVSESLPTLGVAR